MGGMKIVPWVFTLNNHFLLNIKFRDSNLFELKWRNSREKWLYESVGVPSQIKDVLEKYYFLI